MGEGIQSTSTPNCKSQAEATVGECTRSHNHTGRMQNVGVTGFYLLKCWACTRQNPSLGLVSLRFLSFKDARTVSHDLQGRAAEARSFVTHGAQRTFDKAGKVIFSLGKRHLGAHEEHLAGEQVWTMTRSWENESGIVAPWTMLKWTTALLRCWEVISNQHLIFIFCYFLHQWQM